jgi:general secretion pathway protein K
MRQRGLALVLVLWLLALLVGVVGAFALSSRIESLLGRSALSLAQARLAAEAGIELAVLRMRDPVAENRLVPDGRPYNMVFETARLTLRVSDESGRLDLNTADPANLAQLFQFYEVDEEQALALADAIADWRDPDDLVMMRGAEGAEYAAAGLPYGPADSSFVSVAELQRVLGMTPELFQKVAPSLTVYSGRPVNTSFADAAVLAALGIEAEAAIDFLNVRNDWTPASGEPPLAPDGTALSASGSGTYSIEARAALSDGTRLMLTQTVRVGGGDAVGRPYSILQKREGEIH